MTVKQQATGENKPVAKFKDKEEFVEIYGAFMKELMSHPIIGPKLKRSGIVVQFQYTDPDVQITVNFKETGPDPKVAGVCAFGDAPWAPEVTFIQSADFSNRFWQGKENVIAAMAKRQVTARGSIHRALALIPVIRPSFRIYPQILDRLGKKHLIAT
ncbi:MAG: hypothetical protein AAB425_14575 [Bdellovibrionota bacterium]